MRRQGGLTVPARRVLAAVSFGLLASAALAPAAGAFDLTGTWTGKWSCQGFDGSSFKSSNKQSTIAITQTGANTFAANVDGGQFFYNGGAIPDAGAPDTKGEAALLQCGTDNIPFATSEGEILRVRVKVNPASGAGSLKGLSVIETDFSEVLTCKYSYKRVDTADPNVLDCTPL
jgi:hypothetical protein